MKPMIMSQEHVRQMTAWFGPPGKDYENWRGKTVMLYQKIIRDENGNEIGRTIGMCLPNEKPTDSQGNPQ